MFRRKALFICFYFVPVGLSKIDCVTELTTAIILVLNCIFENIYVLHTVARLIPAYNFIVAGAWGGCGVTLPISCAIQPPPEGSVIGFFRNIPHCATT